MTTRIHVSLPVPRLDEAVDFYSRLLGQEPSKLRPDYANFRLDEPPLHLALVHTPAREAQDLHPMHFGIELADRATLETWRTRLATQEVKVREEHAAECCYAVGEKLWATDPAGHEWEVWVRLRDGERMAAKSESCCVPS